MEPLGMLAGAAMEIGMGSINDYRQLNQQERLNEVNFEQHKKTSEYNMKKQMELWEKTGYVPTVDQMKRAGLNPALMYKGAGGGGSTQASVSSQSGAQAPNTPLGLESIMQMQLMKAQKENIEADTENKKAGSQNLTAQAEGKGLENAFNAWMQSTTPEGEDVGDNLNKSTRGQQETSDLQRTKTETQFKLDENERQALMNSKVMEEIGAKISLMVKQGETQDQIYRNLVKEGLLLDAEIEWNKLDISGGNVGKFLTNIIKMALKPR